jgi:hypothetical protein
MTTTADRVTNKSAMKRRLASGEFGNTVRQWPTLERMRADGYAGPVYVRTNVVSDARKMFEVPAADVEAIAHGHGVDLKGCHFYEAPPNDARVIQGEVYRSTFGLYLFYSLAKMPLRDALNTDGRHASPCAARAILDQYLSPESAEWVEMLLDRYDGVVEFTEFNRRVGPLKKTLVVWEVRHY